MANSVQEKVPYMVCWVCGEDFTNMDDSHYQCKSSAVWQKETIEDEWIYLK